PARRYSFQVLPLPQISLFGSMKISRDVLASLDMANYGNRRGPPENGLAGGDPAGDLEDSSAVTTRSPSFDPSMTSVTTPSLIPVLICTGCGRPTDKT